MSVRHIHWSPAPCPGCAEEDTLERIAEAVKAEREACAKRAGDYLRKVFDQPTLATEVEAAVRREPEALAVLARFAAIRARGDK
jgi:hypothetical protein